MRRSSDSMRPLSVGARLSQLSRLQAQEVLTALQVYHPTIEFQLYPVLTSGDKDQRTSLRALDRASDFFTKEIDELILNGTCRLAIHSAKDVPDPLKTGLTLICLTKGLDPRDALVLRPGQTLDTLPTGARIATSSVRREEMVKELRPDLTFQDVRGTIEQRLAKLTQGEADGVVVAEAALIRLGLTDLNRVIIPGETAEGQGQLAVIAKIEDEEMRALFACLDARNDS